MRLGEGQWEAGMRGLKDQGEEVRGALGEKVKPSTLFYSLLSVELLLIKPRTFLMTCLDVV